MELHLYPQRKKVVAQGALLELSVAPAMENHTHLLLEGASAGLRAQPDCLPSAAGHGLLQEMAVPL